MTKHHLYISTSLKESFYFLLPLFKNGKSIPQLSFRRFKMGFKIKIRRKVDKPPLREIAYLELRDSVVEIMWVENPAPPSSNPWQVGYPRFALEVEDMDKAIEYLENRGVKISSGPVNVGNSKRAEIEDPDGLSIELRQW
jgi:glyoxylase I family protein